MDQERTAIEVDGLGVRFRLGRRGRRSFKDLFAGKKRRNRPGEFWALRNVSFRVSHGEAIGVVGRNGQGKSTLLKLVAGVVLPDEGVVEVHGGVAPLIEITGGFVADLSVRENVYLTAGLHGMSKREVDDRFDSIIEFAEIGDFLDTPYKHLSSGMKVRIAFSVVSPRSSSSPEDSSATSRCARTCASPRACTAWAGPRSPRATTTSSTSPNWRSSRTPRTSICPTA